MSELMQKIERATQFQHYDQTGRNEGTGKACKPMKVLLEGTCAFDCAYCEICKRQRGISFTPAELAHGFLAMHDAGRVGGLLLSTGIPKGDVDLGMEKMIETAKIIRGANFRGYLHLKVLPGSNRSDITELAKYATRLSINLEAPDASHLSEIATVKTFKSDLLQRYKWLAEIMPERHSTQFVVGASDETDLDLFQMVATAYEKYHPARIYYSAFHAIEGTDLSHHPNTPLWRANRWYQMDALFRLYGYSRNETLSAFDERGMFLNVDPKVLLAENLPMVNPDTASKKELLRVPGIGVAGAEEILSLRKTQTVRNIEVLKNCGVAVKRALPYLSLGKTRQTTWKTWMS